MLPLLKKSYVKFTLQIAYLWILVIIKIISVLDTYLQNLYGTAIFYTRIWTKSLVHKSMSLSCSVKTFYPSENITAQCRYGLMHLSCLNSLLQTHRSMTKTNPSTSENQYKLYPPEGHITETSESTSEDS